MMGSKNSSTLLLLFFIVFVTFSVVSVEARKHETKKSKPHKHHKGKGGSGNNTHNSHLPGLAPAPLPHNGSQPPKATTFSVLSFGAKGDGVSDDSKALEAAWEAACRVNGATVEIPSVFKFLINPITLEGPCMSHLVLQIDGTLLAPSTASCWPKSSLLQWINFKYVHNFTIQGTGFVDGQGFDWWSTSPAYYPQKRSKHIPYTKPTAFRFYGSSDVTVRNINIINSPQCHLKFDNSWSIKVNNITISSPDDSPNTDGIHLQNTQNVEIHHSHIGCGDDCVSIQTGCSNIHVHHIHCGPGHGISVGGLGENQSTVACVSNIIVSDSSFLNTQSGVRIKTWPGGRGSARNVSFSNIQVSNVGVPIVIDQNYCDNNKKCKNHHSRGAVAISGVKYDRIIGSYSKQPIRLNCSNDIPCTDVDLIDIQLKPTPGPENQKSLKQAECLNSYGKSKAPLVPLSKGCWRRDGGPVKRIAKSHDNIIKCN